MKGLAAPGGLRARSGAAGTLAVPGRRGARSLALRRAGRASGPAATGARARPQRARPGRGRSREAGVGSPDSYGSSPTPIALEGWLDRRGSSVSYGKATRYLPMIDLLQAYFQIEDRETPRGIREKVTGKLLTLDRALKPSLPAFLALLDVPADDSAWQRLDPPQRRQRTLDAVKRLLLRESQEQPLLVVFEDLHWIDAETQALLDSLVESLPPHASSYSSTTGPSISMPGAAGRYYRSSASTRCRRRAPGAAWRCSAPIPKLGPSSALLIERTKATLLPRGERAHLGRDRSPSSASAALTVSRSAARLRCPRPSRRSWRRA